MRQEIAYTDALKILGAMDSKPPGFGKGRQESQGKSHTDLLVAAHTVIAVNAYFQSLQTLDLPVDITRLELTKVEQLILAGTPPVLQSRMLTEMLIGTPLPRPTPDRPYEQIVLDMEIWYATMSRRLASFVQGLTVWDELDRRQRTRFVEGLLKQLPGRAVAQYEDSFRRLAADSPEFHVWMYLTESAASRAQAAKIGANLARGSAELQSLAGDFAVGRSSPEFADTTFERILEIIRATAEAMERSPKTYAGMGEEDRRQIIVTILNTHYRGQVTAEAFNAKGRTDILLRDLDGRNLFIGECKFWSGTKGFIDAIDQLLGYTTWHDTKLGIIMFVREKHPSSLIEKAQGALGQHPQFAEWRSAANETELRATVSLPYDNQRHADLNILFVHTPE